jgi:hypothetical protein
VDDRDHHDCRQVHGAHERRRARQRSQESARGDPEELRHGGRADGQPTSGPDVPLGSASTLGQTAGQHRRGLGCAVDRAVHDTAILVVDRVGAGFGEDGLLRTVQGAKNERPTVVASDDILR